MANIFDIDVKLSGGKDQNVDTHLLNEQFHVFSKSPSSAATSLGSASNRSGHTVTATDVWAEEIPAFYEVPDMNSTASLNANENDLCRVGNGVAIYKNGAWSLEYASYMDIPDGHEFVNASGKPVIRFHKNRLARNLTVKNNAADDGLNSSAKIQGWDKDAQAPYEYVEAAPKFVSQFVTSTDKIVDGKPSKGYGPFVMAGTTTGDITKVLNEGTVDDNDYVANSFAGIIQYNKKRTDAIYVHAFEYCGNSLKTAYSDIEALEDKLSKISVTAAGGVQAVSEAAKSAGFEIEAVVADGVTTPTLDIETGSVTTGETKLVTGDAVKTYVDTTALAEGGSIAKAIADYVATNAKVSVNEVEAKTVTVASGSQTGDLVQIVVTNDKTKAEDGEIGIKLSAQIEAAQWDEATQSFKNPDAVLVAGVAQTVINNTIINQISEVVGDVGEGEKPTIATAIKKGITDATLADADNAIASASGEAVDKLVTAEQVKEYVDENAKVTLTAATATGSTGITINPNGQESTSFTIGIDQTVIATKKSVDDLDTRLDTLTETGGVIESIQSDIDAIETSLTSGAIHTEIDGVRQTANAAKGKADTAVQSVSKASGSSSLLSVTQTGTSVTVGLSDTVATKSDITTEINKLSAADGAITALDGRVSDIETSLAAGGKTAEAIAAAKKAGTDAQTAADGKVANITVDGTSIVTGAAGSKTAALTTTKGVEITPSATSTSTALATEASVAKAIASITSVGVSYEVIPDGQTHISITAPVKGRIYLEKDTTNAEAGVYIEWMFTEKGWEQIGSTKTDHSSYASKITINGSEKSVANSAIDLGAFASSVTAGNGVASGSVSTTGALSLILTTASTTTTGIAQLTDAYTSTDATKAATGKSIATAIGALDATKTVNGLTVTQVDGKITGLSEALIVASVPAGTTSVEGNVAYVGSTKHVIAPEKFETAAQMPSTLTSWVADLSNLTNGDNMFKGTALTTFVGDLSSLTSGVDMFYGCRLDFESLEIIAETLPTVTGSPVIHIGLIGGSGGISDPERAIISQIESKGWNATIQNGGN